MNLRCGNSEMVRMGDMLSGLSVRAPRNGTLAVPLSMAHGLEVEQKA